MLCNLVNFISVNWEPDVGWGGIMGEDKRRKERERVRRKERTEV